MINQKIVKNYAGSLFANIRTAESQEKVLKQLQLLNDILQQSALMRFALEGPIVSKTDKLKIIDVFTVKFGFEKIVKQFFTVMIRNNRFQILPEIVKIYEELLVTSKGIKIVKLEAARVLGKKELGFVKKYLENRLNKIIKLEIVENSSLIGGVVIKYDSVLYDFSVAGMIDKFAEKMRG